MKLFLSYFIRQFGYNKVKDPLSNIFTNLNDIHSILNTGDDLNILKIFYFNRKTIHKLLYDLEEIIYIKFNKNKNNLASNFFLNILIKEDSSIINYSFSIEYIKKVNSERNKSKDKFKNIFYAKCILDLINNYKQTDEYNKDIDESILELIENENKKIININLRDFILIGLNFNNKDI